MSSKRDYNTRKKLWEIQLSQMMANLDSDQEIEVSSSPKTQNHNNNNNNNNNNTDVKSDCPSKHIDHPDNLASCQKIETKNVTA